MWVPEAQRALYHVALAHGANHLVTLVSQSMELLRQAGSDDPASVLRPLLTAALENSLSYGDAALTGPIVRGDLRDRDCPSAHPRHGSAGHLGVVRRARPGDREPRRRRRPARATASRGSHRDRSTTRLPAPPSDMEVAPPGRRCWLPSPAGTPVAGWRWCRRWAPCTTATGGCWPLLATRRMTSSSRSSSTPSSSAAARILRRTPAHSTPTSTLCRDLGVDVVFTPDLETVYPGGEPQVTIEPGPLGTELEGASRPGHFRGVLTVVAKLFGLVGPDVAVFGTKDYQQLVLVRRCVADLCMPVEVVGVETVRAPDGLALSSRNRYLTDAERTAALALSRALRSGRSAAGPGRGRSSPRPGGCSTRPRRWSPTTSSSAASSWPAPPEEGPARLLVAARVGTTRLIDNVAVVLGSADRPGESQQVAP